MNRQTGWTALLLVLMFGGCADKKAEAGAGPASPPAQEQTAQSEPALQAALPAGTGPEQSSARVEPVATESVTQTLPGESAPAAAPPAPAPQPKAAPPRPAETKPAPVVEPTPAAVAQLAQTTPAPRPEPAPVASKSAAPKDVIVLTGSPLGGVRFEHKLHVTRAGNNCATCHHPSRPEKAASAPQQACSDCHTKVAAAPMKTKHQAAFHDPMAQSGTCIDCHKADKAKPKKAPLGCMDCHKQENK